MNLLLPLQKTSEYPSDKADNRPKISTQNSRIALIRHLLVSVDCSHSIDGTDFLPSFRVVINKCLDSFVLRFQTENPLSILSVKRNEGAYFSLKQALTFELSTYIREILLITSSLTIRDGKLEENIEKLIKEDTKVNIISLCGETKIYKTICQRTGGKLYVPLNADHFEELFNKFLVPSNVTSNVVYLLKMGFPVNRRNGICVCHLEIVNGSLCVKCGALVCIPCECVVCNTMNVDGMYVFRNVYFMNYLQSFEFGKGTCSCGKIGTNKCKCGEVYCKECNSFVHEYLKFCIKCGA